MSSINYDIFIILTKYNIAQHRHKPGMKNIFLSKRQFLWSQKKIYRIMFLMLFFRQFPFFFFIQKKNDVWIWLIFVVSVVTEMNIPVGVWIANFVVMVFYTSKINMLNSWLLLQEIQTWESLKTKIFCEKPNFLLLLLASIKKTQNKDWLYWLYWLPCYLYAHIAHLKPHHFYY